MGQGQLLFGGEPCAGLQRTGADLLGQALGQAVRQPVSLLSQGSGQRQGGGGRALGHGRWTEK